MLDLHASFPFEANGKRIPELLAALAPGAERKLSSGSSPFLGAFKQKRDLWPEQKEERMKDEG
jgi:hypothetical protein